MALLPADPRSGQKLGRALGSSTSGPRFRRPRRSGRFSAGPSKGFSSATESGGSPPSSFRKPSSPRPSPLRPSHGDPASYKLVVRRMAAHARALRSVSDPLLTVACAILRTQTCYRPSTPGGGACGLISSPGPGQCGRPTARAFPATRSCKSRGNLHDYGKQASILAGATLRVSPSEAGGGLRPL